MKEFNAQSGGRFLFTEDLLNMQDLALASTSLLFESNNCVISGCAVNGTSISSGYVYINGKIRKFSGASNITSFPQYIVEANSKESVEYKDGTSKIARTIYGCALSREIPTNIDIVTGVVPQFIEVTANGGVGLKEALFGKYGVIKSGATMQRVEGSLEVAGELCSSSINSSDGVFGNDNGSIRIVALEQGAWINGTVANGKTGSIGFRTNGDIVFLRQGDEKLKMSDNGVSMSDIIVQNGRIGALSVGKISESFGDYDGAAIEINMTGFNGGNTFFRNTKIGNGRGQLIAEFDGRSGSLELKNGLVVNGDISERGIALSDKYVESKVYKEFVKTTNSAIKNITPKDTGWISFGDDYSARARQINDIVYIQIVLQSDKLSQEFDWGVVTLPNLISAPQTNTQHSATFCDDRKLDLFVVNTTVSTDRTIHIDRIGVRLVNVYDVSQVHSGDFTINISYCI